MSTSFHFEEPEHFTTGTVGPKGQRTFFLQFGDPGHIVTLKLEKGQVHALAEYLDQLLENVDPVADEDVPLALDLIDPVDPAWVVGTIGVAIENDDKFVLVVEELTEAEDPDLPQDEGDSSTARLQVTLGQVKAFVNRARELVAGGRPPCDYCGRPLDDADGWCPCHN